MAIIGKIRKHSGLAVIIIGVAIAAFVIGDFGKKSARGTSDLGIVNGEEIPYQEFSAQVDQTLETQKENTGSDKITDQETYQIRQSTWDQMVRNILMGEEYEALGLAVSPEELFDQVQGRQPHRYILQYFKDPNTGQYNPAMVLNYLKNLDQMEPKAKAQWLQFEKAISEDRIQTKFNTLVSKGYYVPRAFLKKDFVAQTKSLKVRFVAPQLFDIPDSTIKLTDADFQKFYDKNKGFFYQDQAYRDLDYVVFEVKPSDIDRKKTAEEVVSLYRDFSTSADAMNFANANSDSKVDSTFMKKGKLPGILDSLMFTSPVGTFVPPFEFNDAWYMAKLIDLQERPDSMNGFQILVTWQGLGNESVKRTKEEAKVKADSLLAVLKKSPPEMFSQVAKTISDYPSAKEDGGELKWFTDGDPNYDPFFTAGLPLKPKELTVIETRIGYSVFMLGEKTKPSKKAKVALLTRSIEPSNQTFQDTYMLASAFAGQHKTPEAFDKGATAAGIQKRSAQSVKVMDNFIMGLPNAREIVRWAYAEPTKVGEVSHVFDLTGKYVVVVLKSISEKGQQSLEAVKPRIEPSVRNIKKVEILAERMTKAMAANKDINVLASQFNSKVDTTVLTFAGFSRTALGREPEVTGKIFTLPKGALQGPVSGNFGAYFVIIDDIIEAPAKEDYTYEKMQLHQGFDSRVNSQLFTTIEQAATIKDNRQLFY
jgi:peptidyl-prolyl cis-trans isomerase D